MPSSEPNFDAKMVDWLYDELDPAEAKSFEQHLEANPAAQAEASALMRTREAFRDLDQSEPSAGLSSMLMHEAAQAAVKTPGLWATFSGWFQPVFMHPAASAMATLVVVAGVAGALYSRNGDMAAEPKAAAVHSSNEASAVAMEPSPSLNAPMADPETAMGAAQAEERADKAVEGDEGLAENDGYRVGMADEMAQGAIEEAEDNLGARVEEAKSAFGSSTAKNGPPGKGGFAFDGKENRGSAASSGDGFADNKSGSRGRGFASGPPPAEAVTPSPTSKSDDRAPKRALSKKKARKNAKPSSNDPLARSLSVSSPKNTKAPTRPAVAWEVQKNNGLKAAAKDKRCRDAGRIANDILEKNPSYYKKNVKGSKAVSDCGRFVASETQRRAKQRQKQAARSRKKAAGAPKKAKAAPHLDEATTTLD
jgi:hypothetical protein